MTAAVSDLSNMLRRCLVTLKPFRIFVVGLGFFSLCFLMTSRGPPFTARSEAHLERTRAPESQSSAHLERTRAPESQSSAHLERTRAPESQSSAHLERTRAPESQSSGHFEGSGARHSHSSWPSACPRWQ
ncbi:unnamed protein product [Arctogadus glacialis]